MTILLKHRSRSLTVMNLFETHGLQRSFIDMKNEQGYLGDKEVAVEL